MKLMCKIFKQLALRQSADPTSPKAMCYPTSPSTFYRDELEAALREQLFAVQSYKITGSTARQSSASLVTLEGLTLTIILNTQGYSVDPKRSDVFQCSSPGQSHVYETVENLLHSISPLYTMKRQSRLFEALQALS